MLRPSRIVWHWSGCGWAVERDAYVAPPPPPAFVQCLDDNAAINAAFAQTAPDVVPNMCGVAATLPQRGYCDNAMFAAMCPLTCKAVGACKDDDVAMSEFLVMTGGGGS